MPYRFDFSHWPVLLVEMSGESDDEALEHYLADHEAVLQRCQPYVLLVEGSQTKVFHNAHRKQLASWMAAHKAELKQFRRAMAYVSNSAMTRGMLTAIYWLFPPPYPYKFFSSLEEGLSWCREQVEKFENP